MDLVGRYTIRFSAGSNTPKIHPAPLRVAIPIFAATSLLFFAALYILLPILRSEGVSWFATYNLVLAMPMLFLVIAAFAAYAMEARDFEWLSIRDRFRLGAMDVATWFWTAALSTFMFGGRYSVYVAFAVAIPAVLLENRRAHRASVRALLYVALFLVCSWLLWQTTPILHRMPLHSEPESLRDFLAQFGPTTFMGIPLKGQWWIAIYYLVVLLFGNIAGEELWWRGYLLPRQELSHGSTAWLVHGVLWASFHLFFQTTAWDLVRMVPTCCALAFVAQHKRNTWPGMIGHTFGNSRLLLQILHGI